MAHYNVVVEDSSPLLTYAPPNAWVDTPLEFKDSPSTSYHATQDQGATVKLDFVGTGVRVFSATVPAPGSYEVHVDGKKLSEGLDSTSKSDSQLLLGSIAGLKMGPHTVTLVNTGATGGILDIERVQVESAVTGSSSMSAANFDDTVGAIRWGPGWVFAPGPSTFYNSTIHYTEQPDAKMDFSFEGDAIAIYGATGVEIGDYVVTLDGQSRTFNGGSNGSVRSPHDQTMLFLASGLSAGRHELAITANPSSLGNPQVFSVDSVRVFSGSSTGPLLLPPGSSGTGISSTPSPPASTGSSYTSLISSTVFSTSTPLPTSTPSTLPRSSMPLSSFTPSLLTPVARFDSIQQNNGLQEASDKYKVMTDKGVISSAIFSAFVAIIGLVFFGLFLWKRKTLEPPSYMDIEKGDKPEKGPTVDPGETSPELPIQAEKISPGPEGNDDPFTDYVLYVHYPGSMDEQNRGHSRNGSNASSMTSSDSAYSLYREILQKRSLLTESTSSLGSIRRDSVSDRYSSHLGYSDQGHHSERADRISSMYSVSSRYSQMSERIIINNVRMPPQFAPPMRPPSVALLPRPKDMSPQRPPRGRDSLALPF